MYLPISRFVPVWKDLLGLAGLLAASAATVVRADDANHLRTLPVADVPRFKITDRVWPAKPGDADVCLWQDDKLAAVSFTIDDNTVGDHPWWLEQGQKYGFHFTWFVVSGNVGKFKTQGDQWSHFIKLHDAGHDIESHTVDHFGKIENSIPTEQNYADAIKQIEAGVPGVKVVTLAYPGGKGGQVMNSREIAAKYYIACRGVEGYLNPVNKTNYNCTYCVGGPANQNPSHYAGLPRLLEPKFDPKSVYRGWCVMLYHKLTGDNRDRREGTIALFDYLTTNLDSYWVAPFTPVAKYGEERDTTTLVSKLMADGKISLKLGDKMDDTLFDQPLTIKVRLDSAWTKISAIQAGKPVPAKIVSHEGGTYALVDIVPDRGETVLAP